MNSKSVAFLMKDKNFRMLEKSKFFSKIIIKQTLKIIFTRIIFRWCNYFAFKKKCIFNMNKSVVTEALLIKTEQVKNVIRSIINKTVGS